MAHRGEEVDQFLTDYFADPKRSILLVAGAGFDPRSCVVPVRLAHIATGVHAVLIKEERPNPSQPEVERADQNTATLSAIFPNLQVESINIFDRDGAIVGGRQVMRALGRVSLANVTDIVVDVSALSVGTSFPTIRYFVECISQGRGGRNLHIVVAHEPSLDAELRGKRGDTAGYVHGFKGGSTLFGATDAARLWLPQLATERRGALARLYDFVRPHDTCPILPFPARDPRVGDVLIEEYLKEFEGAWSVDSRNIVYADEADPLDLYRTILKLDDRRQPVFAETGGSMLFLSPLGSKVMAIGALMAALERNLPVAYVESIGYRVDSAVPSEVETADLVHVWLEGDVYPQPRPGLMVSRRGAI